ncbi:MULTISPECIES: flagellar export chaperone FliS [Paenibacillus]|uniref:Flagellar secretion chaperone FliS n=1 Tax=Paenibacillus taichungensis TaxID=484184 RepID=A0ABX2MDB5_9BACL|nr:MULTISPECIES: flagellar export chaperone FliS [Paenibacillus]NUU52936.1 flagellar export chaperone FliS [Paenibacillus taichungensis]SLK07065.1 flagellar protein FliS [Paenibacillus sp. RU5A]SOC70710.1 flagellar protein FliS [Paenibacillus sp. RU26A]SOC72887.1 flagellar protein FliS [Paenibacillus sp. RU5M]
MIKSPYDQYRQSSVQTSSPGQLLIMLYDGAIRFVRTAIDGLGAKDYQKVSLNLGKAQTIVSELSVTLDRSADIAENLNALYEYINFLLIDANTKKNAEPAEEALGYLKELKETWVQASKMVSSSELGAVHG